MLTEYTEKIDKTFNELQRIQTKIDTMLNSKDSIKLLDDVKVYKNYALIFAYGCIENITKNLIADYYKKRRYAIKVSKFCSEFV